MSVEHTPMEEMNFFLQYVEIADKIWRWVSQWKPLASDTVGKQLVRAADSVGANLVEGDGRHGSADSLHFFVIARASARETRYWIERASARGLLTEAQATESLDAILNATRQLNALIRYRRAHKNNVILQEEKSEYSAGSFDPFVTF